jgi:sulfite reductase (ferredoxin)
VVTVFSMEMSKAESENFDAQVELDEERFETAERLAYKSMLMAAQALVRTQNLDVTNEPDAIVDEFRKRFVDTKVFFDKYAGAKFAHYLLNRHVSAPARIDYDVVRQRIEEAQLFIEATHACEARLGSAITGGTPV